MPLLDNESIQNMGFSSVGKNVFISDKASFYNCANISIGDNVRIDDFCIISAGEGGIIVGNHIHVAVYSSLIGTGKIVLNNFCNLSSRVSIYSSSDDYSGEWMTNPTIPKKYTNVYSADVTIGRHVIIGTGSVVMPGIKLGDGVAIGALSFVKNNCEAFGIYAGVPAKRISERKKNIIALEHAYLSICESNMCASSQSRDY